MKEIKQLIYYLFQYLCNKSCLSCKLLNLIHLVHVYVYSVLGLVCMWTYWQQQSEPWCHFSQRAKVLIVIVHKTKPLNRSKGDALIGPDWYQTTLIIHFFSFHSVLHRPSCGSHKSPHQSNPSPPCAAFTPRTTILNWPCSLVIICIDSLAFSQSASFACASVRDSTHFLLDSRSTPSSPSWSDVPMETM